MSPLIQLAASLSADLISATVSPVTDLRHQDHSSRHNRNPIMPAVRVASVPRIVPIFRLSTAKTSTVRSSARACRFQCRRRCRRSESSAYSHCIGFHTLKPQQLRSYWSSRCPGTGWIDYVRNFPASRLDGKRRDARYQRKYWNSERICQSQACFRVAISRSSRMVLTPSR